MISAIILAAGQSIRMGQPKMLMPWGETSVIVKVVDSVTEGGVQDICVITGNHHKEIIKALIERQVRTQQNENFANGEMLTSVQVGLQSLSDETEAALVVLGDQPQIKSDVVREIIDRYHATHHPIIIPSYQMHRGHPWLVEKSTWPCILKLTRPDTLRTFLITYADKIDYILVNTPSILQDLDTQDDYQQYKP
jgi:molybdenum cofactor cytidylyltransferase